MALSFPPQPQTQGTIYEAPNGINYTWDGNKWVAAGAPGAGSGINLGNLYIIDQTIAGLNEGANINIVGNLVVSDFGDVIAHSFHADLGYASGGFTFNDPIDGSERSGIVHANGENRLEVRHSGNTGFWMTANGSTYLANVDIKNIIGPVTVFQSNISADGKSVAAGYFAARTGTSNGYTFFGQGGATKTAILHDDALNQLQIRHENFVGVAIATDHVEIANLQLDGTTLAVEAGTLYVDGIAVGGPGFGNELVSGDYTVTLYPNGNTIIPGTISSTAAGIPEFNSTTDLNLTAVNRVNIVNSPLNLGAVIPNTVIGKPGDIIYHPALQEIQAYINGAWENLLRTAENQNVRLPQGGAFQRADGVRAAWFTELPSDISQLTDNNNLLTTQSITLQNIDIDGGGAYSIYDTGLMFADGGFGSSRFGPSDTVFDGAGASGGYTNSLNGGGA